MALEQVIDGLFHHRLMKVMPLGDLDGLHDLRRRPFGCAPVERLALLNKIMHRPDRLFDGGGLVGAVAEEKVHVIELEAFKRSIHSFDEPLAVECVLLVHAFMQAPIKFGRDQITAPTPLQLLERRAHHTFRFAARVHFRIVEEVHACIVRRRHDLCRGFDIRLVVERNPRTQRQLADFDTRFSQMTIFHVVSSIV